MKRQKSIFIALAIWSLAWSQLSITNVDGVAQYVIDFDTTVEGVNNGQWDGTFPLANPQNGDLDADAWSFKRTLTLEVQPDDSLTYFGGTSNGGVTAGKFYSYDISNGGVLDRAVGFQPTSVFLTPGSITLYIVNNTGTTITHITVSYEIWEYNTAGYSTYVYFSHSIDNSTYTHEPSVDFLSVELGGTSEWVLTTKAIWLQGLNIPDGSSYYLRWDSDDYSGSGSRDEIAIDDITISMGNALDVKDIQLPADFGFRNAFPNPFNPVTTLRYTLGARGNTVIRLFNLKGEFLEEISHGVRNPGDHTLRFDGSRYPSGVYVIELTSPHTRDSQIITLLK